MSGDRCRHCGKCSVPVAVVKPADLSHTGKTRLAIVPVDACIADVVRRLNAGATEPVTRGACCGHGRGPGSIMFVDGRELRLETVKGEDMTHIERREQRVKRQLIEELLDTFPDPPNWIKAERNNGVLVIGLSLDAMERCRLAKLTKATTPDGLEYYIEVAQAMSDEMGFTSIQSMLGI